MAHGRPSDRDHANDRLRARFQVAATDRSIVQEAPKACAWESKVHSGLDWTPALGADLALQSNSRMRALIGISNLRDRKRRL
jgi:hypothetical protein